MGAKGDTMENDKIAQDACYAYRYALDVLDGPFPSGEAAIAQDACYACLYALYVLHGPFPAGSAAIAQDPGYAYLYALYVLHGGKARGRSRTDLKRIIDSVDG